MRKSLLLAVLSTFVGLGCTRKVDKPATIGISLSGLTKANKAGTLTVQEIGHLVLNISGPGMAPIVKNYDAHDGRTIPNPIIVEGVKSGDARLIQILVVGRNTTTGEEHFLYGDQTKTLNGGENPVTISVSTISSGNGTQAQIAGRYLDVTGTAGPTGVLQLTFKPPTAPAMNVLEMPMINGWFQIFLIDGANFSYHFKHDPTKKPFENLDFNHATFAPSQRVLHVVQPAGTAYYQHDSSVEPRPSERHVLGFFGPGAGSIPRTICYDGTEGDVENMYLDPAHTTAMQWEPDSAATNVVRRLGQSGGVEDPDGPCASGNSWIDRLDFDGKYVGSGRTKTFGFESAFKIADGEWEAIEADEAGGVVTLTWETLPGAGVGEGAVDGFGVFLSTNGYTGSIDDDGIDCTALAADPATGFYHVGDATSNSYVLPSLTSAQLSVARLAVCPFKNGHLGQAKYYFKGGRMQENDGGGSNGPALDFGDGSDGNATINVGMNINATGGAHGRVTAIVDGGSYLDVTVGGAGGVDDNMNFQSAGGGSGEVMFVVMGARSVSGSPGPDATCAPNGVKVGAFQFSSYAYQSGGSQKVIRIPKSGNTLVEAIRAHKAGAGSGMSLIDLTEPWCYLQAVRVPNFNNLTIEPTREILAPPFSLESNLGGGVIALRVSGTLTMDDDAAINVSYSGFRGGVVGSAAAGQGVEHVNGGHGGQTGSSSSFGGGGGGHHGNGGSGGNSGGTGGNSQWHCGSMCASTDHVLFAGAGGGASFTSGSGNGGAGGGIIYVQANNFVSIATNTNPAFIKAFGQAGGTESGGSSAGGGGAGGTVVLWTGSITAPNASIEVNVGGHNGGGAMSGAGGGGGSGGRATINTCTDESAKFNQLFAGGTGGSGAGGNGVAGQPGEFIPRTGICSGAP